MCAKTSAVGLSEKPHKDLILFKKQNFYIHLAHFKPKIISWLKPYLPSTQMIKNFEMRVM